jgi:RNA polymerase sigma-70 factor, ECF subfamily
MREITDLSQYHHYHAAIADMLRRLGRLEEAADEYRAAPELAGQPAEGSFLELRLGEVSGRE